ncbi:aminopeptidase N [Nitzschia inconspicua]|uniref:Aminopeptidase N n=1 Tax=Nitzschia inconspicua TaxID=303405 RepID=A0A9K3KGB1_9STRA|nr:aminopeptidase N [Nitzschia inconspicua]
MFFRAKAVSLWCLAAASMTSSAAFSPRVVFAQQQVNNKRVNQVCVGGMSSSGTCLVASSPAAALYSRGGSTASLSTTALNSAVVTDKTAAAAPVEIFRKDYQPLPMIVSKINMDFSIHEGKTTVHSELYIEGNPAVNLADGTDKDLVLDGDETAVKLLSITLNEKELEQGKDYILEPGKLILKNPPPKSVLKTTVEIVPEENTQLSGLYNFTTSSGRKVDLQLFSEPDNVHKLQYAMDSLKRSMKWDEDVYGLEYDLDLYNIVAVNSFNMGAMENKGLNVFNTAYVLADQATATDTDFERVEGVIGHEYFHNWTGNRVTCRDWFQLTLKEGLTVFRDQEFSGDMNSKAVNRIENVQALRARQFAEDAGPMSHPIRPESYISMDNFYTSTVYNKGAEIIRMYQTLLGKDGFRKGMDLYFERHDGSAVTCDDFLAAMADANGVDLSQFSLWYSTPGTPVVSYSYEYDQPSKKFKLTLTQESKSDSGPLHIPVSVGLLDKNTGEEVVPTTVLDLKKEKQTFEFENLSGDVVPSILRQFSAPVKLVAASGEQDEEALAFLAARDTDGFNKWEAGQVLFTNLIFQVMDGKDKTASKTWDFVKEAFGRTLNDYDSKDYSIVAYALNLPTESTLAELVDVVDPIAIHKSRGNVKRSLAREFHDDLLKRYKALTDAMSSGEFKVDAESIGQRRLRNICMDYLCSIRETPQEQIAAAALAKNHYESATCMTDKVAALNCLASMDGEGASARDEIIECFYDEAEGDALVLNKWFSIQAMADLPDILDRVKALKAHPDFTLKNPNRCRSLVGAFSMNSAFHDETGAGYRFIREVLEELDPLNPQISSRLAGSLITWKKYDEERGLLMKAELEKLSKLKPISDDMFEIVSRGLK